ncbi:MAG: helix-turn-helix domain-containing protein [Bacteroidia bacterium]
MTEIAFKCGFNSISRFNAAFLKINRRTPRDFRKSGPNIEYNSVMQS